MHFSFHEREGKNGKIYLEFLDFCVIRILPFFCAAPLLLRHTHTLFAAIFCIGRILGRYMSVIYDPCENILHIFIMHIKCNLQFVHFFFLSYHPFISIFLISLLCTCSIDLFMHSARVLSAPTEEIIFNNNDNLYNSACARLGVCKWFCCKFIWKMLIEIKSIRNYYTFVILQDCKWRRQRFSG